MYILSLGTIISLDIIACAALLVVSVTDIRENRIPNRIIFPAILAASVVAVIMFMGTPSELARRFLGVAVLFVAGAGLRHIIGLGDIKAVMLMIICSGITRTLYASMFAFILLILYAVATEKDHGRAHLRNITMMCRGASPDIKGGKKYPMAPFLFIGYIAAMVLRLTGIIR